MALDGIFIHSLLDEIKNKILNGRVEKIAQPEKDEIILSIKNNRKTYKLSISASPVYPKINFTSISKKNPLKPPMFCMVLRKYLNSSKILSIKQLETDRIIFIDFESSDEMGFNSIYTLIVEIMGRHSNITLIRKRDSIIMDSIKHITPDINSVRTLLPNIEYVYPPLSQKLNPLNFSFEEFKNYIKENNIDITEKCFSKIFIGISSQFSKEIYFRLINKYNIELDLQNFNNIYNSLLEIFNLLKNKEFNYFLYSKDNKVKDFYCFKLTNLSGFNQINFDSPSDLVETFYYKKDKADRLNSKSSNLQRLINLNVDRCTKKIKILNKNLDDCAKKDKFKIKGELLTANIYLLKKGLEKIEVLNYYTNETETIKLDPNKTPSENVQKCFKKYNKLKKAEVASKEQIELAKEELLYLNSVSTNLANVDTYEDIEDIKKELIQTKYIKLKKQDKKKKKKSKPMHLISSDDIDLYVGKNNFQNDYLTLKFANKHDIWLHTKDIPGSHVIIKNFTGEIPDTTLEEAANLAAYYSKGKSSNKVAVDYTEVKNVHKPNGAKPGRVIYYTNKTIYIDPKEPTLKQV
ncbi:Rqc2 family fibronectin-binding protein [Clostridium oceanicum]|uniref:Rqc2 homolog RqcH n=1 Tax=Clostridium oceanicum TaxID=1543 RepID=A0ABN1JNW2_9CLOT